MKPSVEQIAVPTITGKGVPSKANPTGPAIATDITVEMAAMTEVAIPAMWPIFCKASALRLPKVRPAMKKTLLAQTKKPAKASHPDKSPAHRQRAAVGRRQRFGLAH